MTIDQVLANAIPFAVVEGNNTNVLRSMPEGIAHCCVTSPPYWRQREYLPDNHPSKALELGNEETLEGYLDSQVAVFREVRRVLRADGTLWLNISDGYADGGNGAGGIAKTRRAWQSACTKRGWRKRPPEIPHKGMIGIPWRLALALQDDGWVLRADCIWAKPNPQPEGVRDRPVRAHEYVFLLAKSERYFYDRDAIREPHQDLAGGPERFGHVGQANVSRKHAEGARERVVCQVPPAQGYNPLGRNATTVWRIPTQRFDGNHFATFPERLARRCIEAGTSQRGCCPACGAPWTRVVDLERRIDGEPVANKSLLRPAKNKSRSTPSRAQGVGHNRIRTWGKASGWQSTCDCKAGEPIPCVVLDPYSGAGTAGVVARKLQRRYIGIELSPDYVRQSAQRIAEVDGPLFAEASA